MRKKAVLVLNVTVAFMIGTGIPAAADTCLPLQVGNTWRYYWADKLPQGCEDGTSDMGCFLEGTYSLSTISATITLNNKEYFLLATYNSDTLPEGGEAGCVDTLCREDDAIYEYNVGGDVLLLNCSEPPVSYSFTARPKDTLQLRFFNNQIFSWPPLLGTYTVRSTAADDTLRFLGDPHAGSFVRIDYSANDSSNGGLPFSWSEYYWPGVGLVYAESSPDPHQGWFRDLDSAYINGAPIDIAHCLPRHMPGPALSRGAPGRYGGSGMFSLTGRRLTDGGIPGASHTERRGIIVDMRRGMVAVQ